MSEPERRARENGCELEPYTNWPLILGAVAFVIVGVGTIGTMAGVTAVASAPKAVYRWVTRAETPVARATPTARPRVVVPAPVVDEQETPARSVAVEHIDMLGMPRIETAASLALEKMTFDKVVPRPRERPAPRLDLVVLGEEELLKLLLERSKEIDIGNEKGLVATLTEGAKVRIEKDKKTTRTEAGHQTISALVRSRTDLYGLPLVDMKDCALSPAETKSLTVVSRAKRPNRANPNSSLLRERHGSTATLEGGPQGVLERGAGVRRTATITRGESSDILIEVPAEIVRPLLQVFEVQPEESRLLLARVIAKSKSDRSARALVRLAVFDLSEKVRGEAARRLADQDKELVRAELLAAFRHPWAPASIHAAKAAALLDDKDMIPELKNLLDKPDPLEPFQEKGAWFVRELVRVNHLKNCLLCHPPAGAERSLLSGSVPLRDREIPVDAYYGSREKGIPLVNASTIYLRQDFSVLHPVKDAKPWPELQRFDYLVRTRLLKSDEIPKEANPSNPSYPQREAVRALLAVLECEEPAPRPGS